jgi:hypothetical protein
MFAKSSDKENYHLLQPDEERTIRPLGYELCEACASAASEQQQPA